MRKSIPSEIVEFPGDVLDKWAEGPGEMVDASDEAAQSCDSRRVQSERDVTNDFLFTIRSIVRLQNLKTSGLPPFFPRINLGLDNSQADIQVRHDFWATTELFEMQEVRRCTQVSSD